MSTTHFLNVLALGMAEPAKEVTDADTKAFLKKLAKLPARGELFTKDAVKKAVPDTRILLALTPKDLENYDLYPFLALSRGLIEHKEARQYGTTNFDKIAHPRIKLFWAAVLFDKHIPSAEIVTFLRKALKSKQQARTLAGMLGPGFEDFKERVIKADETGKATKVELVKKHLTKAFPKLPGGLDYTKEQCVFAPGQLLYAVRPLKQRGELCAYNLAKRTTTRLVIPQPKGFKATYDFATYFDDAVLSINCGGDLLCRWSIEGGHALALLKKGSHSFLVKRVSLSLSHCCVVADPDGAWYLVRWPRGADFTVYQLDKELNLTRLGNFKGKGLHSVGILNTRFITKDVLHLFWGDVVSGNHLRMRCVDFDVKKQKWLHNREVFRLDKFVSSANEPTVLQLKDESLHYVWKIDEGARQGKATGLYYQAEADGKTVKVGSGYQYSATAVGDRIILCYTLKDSPNQVFLRVIHHGALGPRNDINIGKAEEFNLGSEYLLLYAEADRIWFVNTLARNTLYELKMVDQKKS
jgi:hypothetical protein